MTSSKCSSIVSRLALACLAPVACLAVAQSASASNIAYDDYAEGAVAGWHVDTWTFAAAEGDSVTVTLSDVTYHWWWFEMATQVDVRLIDASGTTIDSARCGSGPCLDAQNLSAGEHAIEVSFRRHYATYGLSLSAGYCLEMFGDSVWPCMGECDATPFSFYFAKNLGTPDAAEATWQELVAEMGESNVYNGDYAVSVGSCQSSATVDCGDAPARALCGVQLEPRTDDDFANLCELQSSVKARALDADAPLEETAYLFYTDGVCI